MAESAARKKRKPKPPTGRLLFEPVKLASRYIPKVLVSFSGGKDSVVTLDLCMRHFKWVHAFFMYQVGTSNNPRFSVNPATQ